MSLRAGIIGCGGITERRHGPVLHAHPEVELVALADISEQRLSLLGERHGVAAGHRYRDYEEMLKSAELDFVHVCTPHDMHEAQAVAAVEAQAHVLLEKPIATTVAEANRMIAAANRADRLLTVCHNQLYSVNHRAARQLIDAGQLGAVFLVRCEGFSASHVSGRGENRDWRTQAYAGGGGPLIDNGFHWIYRALDYTDSAAVRVYARTGRHTRQIEVEDTALVLIEHASGATTSIQVGWSASGGSVNVHEVFGTKGQLRFGSDPALSLWCEDDQVWSTVAVGDESPDELGFPTLVAKFVDALQGKGVVPVRGESSRHALQVVLAAYESGRSNEAVEITTA